MRAAIIRRYGPPSSVEIGELRDPVPGPGQIRVRVRASSLNPLDARLRAGRLRLVMPLRFPAVLGFDVAGEVDALGPEVAAWSEGDAVYGRIDARTGGAHAELAIIRASVVDAVPDGLSFEAAASLPLVAMTAIQAFEQVGLRAGERVLINGAAGGVGSAAVQVARAFGATVTGVCSSDSAPLVAALGARVVDYTRGELEALEDPFDVILDTVFDSPSDDMELLLGGAGRYVTTGFSARSAVRALLGPISSGPRFHLVMSRADGRLMREISGLVAHGQLVPVIDSILPFERIAEAHERLAGGHLRGKVVVAMPAPPAHDATPP